ncbi:hypothetical protein GN956_G14284 [Arapaima gigas]
MSPLQFCANISWLFTEAPGFAERMRAAAAAGFRAVEAAWLYDADLHELRAVKDETGLEVALLNTPPGAPGAGELGLAAVPGREPDFRRGLDLAVTFAKGLDCKRIHLMAGRLPAGTQRSAVAQQMETTFVENLKYAADVLSKEGITGLIEPINTRITDPRYFLATPHQAAAILQKVDRPNIQLQMDLFHWQIMDGNLTKNIETYFPLIGKCHVQVAQVPQRTEPDAPGELSFPYLFTLLEELGYHGYVGCEYRPRGSTDASLGWIRRYWRERGVGADDRERPQSSC